MSDLARRLGRAYLGLASRIGLVAGVVAAAAVTSAIVVLPFWYLATMHRTAFNTLVGVVCALGAGVWIARRLSGLEMPALRRVLARAGGVALGVALLYVALWGFASGRLAAGVAAAVGLLLAAGLRAR